MLIRIFPLSESESREEPETAPPPPPSCATPQVTAIYNCCQIICYEGDRCEPECPEDAVACQARRKRDTDDAEVRDM